MKQNYLTPQEAADILKVKKTTVYDMIKKGRLKAVKMGKQFRILESDVQSVISGQPVVEPAEPIKVSAVSGYYETDISVNSFLNEPAPPKACVLCGQDMLLDMLCGYVNGMMAATVMMRSYLGSYNGLYALYQGQVNAATAHLWDVETDTYNIPFIKKLLPGENVHVYHIVNRHVGIYVSKGNPKGIKSIDDFTREDVTMLNREKGSGIRVLTDSLFNKFGIEKNKLKGYDRVVSSHLAAATIISRGGADCSMGSERTVLHMPSVDFVPFKYESYDLIIPDAEMHNPIIQKLIEIIKTNQFRLEVESLGGYDVADMGKKIL